MEALKEVHMAAIKGCAGDLESPLARERMGTLLSKALAYVYYVNIYFGCVIVDPPTRCSIAHEFAARALIMCPHHSLVAVAENATSCFACGT